MNFLLVLTCIIGAYCKHTFAEKSGTFLPQLRIPRAYETLIMAFRQRTPKSHQTEKPNYMTANHTILATDANL